MGLYRGASLIFTTDLARLGGQGKPGRRGRRAGLRRRKHTALMVLLEALVEGLAGGLLLLVLLGLLALLLMGLSLSLSLLFLCFVFFLILLLFFL